LKKFKFVFFLLAFTVIISVHFCYADENMIDESRLNGYYVGEDKEFTNGYGIIEKYGSIYGPLYGLIDKDYNVVMEPKYYLITHDCYDKNIIYVYMDIYSNYGDIYKITEEGLKKIASEISMNPSFKVPLESADEGFQDVGGESIASNVYCYIIAVKDKEGKHYGVIDKSGNFIFPLTDKYIYDIINDFFIVRYELTGAKTEDDYTIAVNGELLNNKGEVLTESKYDYIKVLNNYIKVSKDGKENILSMDNYTELLDWLYNSIDIDNKFIIAKNSANKYGLLDLKGNVLTDFVYDKIDIEHTGIEYDKPVYIYVKKGDNFNLLDINDYHELLDWSYFCSEMCDDYIIVRDSNNKYGMMDIKGNIIVDFLYNDLYTSTTSTYVIAENSNNKYALFDDQGNNLTDFVYRNIQWSDDYGFYTVNKNGYIQKIKLPGESDESIKNQEMYLNENSHLNVKAYIYEPNTNITVNGIKIDNSKKLYPFISSEGVAYVPITYYDSRFLNLKTRWDPEIGLKITHSDEVWEYTEETTDKENPYSFEATVAYYDIYINGKKIKNFKRDHPILIYKDIAYIPVTQDLAEEELGWYCNYSQKDGLVINSR